MLNGFPFRMTTVYLKSREVGCMTIFPSEKEVTVMVKLYARITGLILLVTGIMGFLTDDLLGLIQFDSVHNMIHLLIAAIALYVGFGTDDTSLPHFFTEVMGFVY